VLGLFAGGSLKVEAEGLFEGRAELIDMGSEEFTRGRPHPMIDASLRKERIVKAGQDPKIGALLLDFVLGIGAASDPAGDLAPSIVAARGQASKQGRELVVIASVVGTPEDPQGLEAQRQKLRDAGAEVFETSLRAAMAARELLP
jgi:FdrA protein